ncbi:TlpA family protein disulfide reductase [Saccharicrinis aurantiacus]|uniref:TlpA family protein disulfide reductase n=1 Tax=Saccharicrinis aurantiacus TaxID=1849719 RepID=UPI00248FCD87|nr:TlpA disulfide reductase family protein [Saccharicrinis aurantiacus]
MKICFSIIFTVFFCVSMESQTIRDFSATSLDNNTVTFSSLKGEGLTVLDFWASWCKPCLKSMPYIEGIYTKYKDQGVSVVGVNTDGPRSQSKVKPIIKSLNIHYPIILDMNNNLMNDLNVLSLPTLLIVDKNNKVIYRHEGFVKGDEKRIEEELEKYL